MSEAESRFEAATARGLTRMVGRNAEVDALLDAWARVKTTGSGHAALLQGEAGIGKSRIASALRERLQAQHVRTMLLQCSPYYVNSAFYPIRAFLSRAAGLLPEEPVEARLDKLDGYFRERLQTPGEDMRLIAALMEAPSERYGANTLSPKLAKEETMRALLDSVRAECRNDPLLVLVEDTHWSDPTTLDFLRRLVDRLGEIPALLVVTARPEFRSPWKGRPFTSAIELARLTPDESRALVSTLVGGKALPVGLEAQIVARADGVPLFLEELTKSILESDALVLDGDQYIPSGGSSGVAIPETLRDSLMARLDRAPASKEIAQVGAVIGREFDYELIAALKLMKEEALANGLRLLTAAGLATRHGEIPHASFAFSHALVQDAAYESLLKSRRRHLHADIARLLEERWPESSPELLAYHWAAAGEHQKAATLWLRAGRIAMERFALPEAISHLRAGLSTLKKAPPSQSRDLTELSLRSSLGPALVAQQGWAHPDVSDALEPAWILAQSLARHESYLPILNALAIHTMSIGRLGESLGWSDKMMSAGERLANDGLSITGYRAASATYYWLGEFAQARRAGDKVHELYDAKRHHGLVLLTNLDPFTGEGVYRCQYLWITGFPDQALAANRATEASARLRGHPFGLAFALTLGAQVFDYLGDSASLLQRTDEAERIGREHGIPLLGEIMAEISRGIAWLRAGRTEDGVAQLDHGVARIAQTGHGIWISYLRSLQADGLAALGEVDRAFALVEEAVSRIEAAEERSHYAEVLRLRGKLLSGVGKDEDAEAALRRSLDVARAQGAKSWELRTAVTLARLWARLGRKAEALALLEPVYRWFTEGLDTPDLKAAARAIEVLRGAGDADDGW